MADQLQEMLQKIYDEGVNKAKEEAEKILASANKEADDIRKKAKEEAEKNIQEAKQNSIELDKKMHSDLKMAAQQALTALKNKVTNAIVLETIDKQITAAMQDSEFLKKLILEILGKWSPESNLVLTIPENKRQELENFFKESVQKVFAGKLQIDFSPVMKNGITITPADGSYKLNFTDEDFANFFKAYLRPKAVQILFGE